MALILPYNDILPQFDTEVFLAENATVIGDVHIGERSSIWFQAVLRGDVDAIRIGKETNIQDAAILHCTSQRCPLVVGDRVTVGHRAILHSCTVEDEALVGMGAIILDEAVVPKHTIVGAGALVTERSVLESGFLYAGIPARKIRALSPEQIDGILSSALHYTDHATKYRRISGRKY